MIRYYLAATAIVVLIGSVFFAHRLRPPDLRVAARPTGTPTVEQPSADAPPAAAAFSGQGDWVLSALPDCFSQRSAVRGPLVDLSAKLPPAAERVAPGSVLHAGDCTVRVRGDDLWVERGADRLRVPPSAALYRDADGLTLVVRHGQQVDLRRYAEHQP